MSINSRAKGAAGELEWAHWLKDHGYQARRGQQFSGSPDSPDVVTEIPLHFEVKRVEALNLGQAMDKAMYDAGGLPPCIAHRRNNRPWMVTMLADHWIKLVQAFYKPQPSKPAEIQHPSSSNETEYPSC